MTDHSRRNFLRTASIGAAAIGAAAVVPVVTAGSADAATPDVSGPTHKGPFMVWVKDAAKGDVAVLVGEHEVVHHDRALARRLAAIAATAPHSS